MAFFLTMQHTTGKDEQVHVQPYIQRYYNVRAFYDPRNIAGPAMIRMINTLIHAMNRHDIHLLKTLIVVLDKDILTDIAQLDTEVSERQAHIIIAEMVRWFVRQVNTVLRQKRANLYEK